MRIHQIMTPDVSVISPHESVSDAARMMDDLNVGALPVCDGRRLVGMITDRDITVRCVAAGRPPRDTPVHDVMSEDIRWCYEDDLTESAERQMARMQVRRLPVLDRRGNLVGMVSLGDLATAHAQGTSDTLRRISEPCEPDRSGPPRRTGRGEERRSRDDRELRYGEDIYDRNGRDDRRPMYHYRRPSELGYAEGLGASGMDYAENHDRGDDDIQTVERDFDDTTGGFRRGTGRDSFNPDFGQHAGGGEGRPVFDRAQEASIFDRSARGSRR